MPGAVESLLANTGPHPRADAQRNAERLIAAAQAALDERGLAITTREVAQRAGVGLGTLYRRVPALNQLLTAILIDTIDEMTERAGQAINDPDPWRGFAEFAKDYVRLRAASCGLHEALGSDSDHDLGPHIERLTRAMRRLIRQAQRSGVLRADLDWRDIPFVLAGAIPTARTIGLDAKQDQWLRNLSIILEGLRASR